MAAGGVVRQVAVEGCEILAHEFGVGVAARIDHARQRGRAAGDHRHARRSCAEDQPVDAVAVLEGKLLGERAAPGDAHDIDDVKAEPVAQLAGPARGHPVPVRPLGDGAEAHAGHVEGQDLAVREHVAECECQFEVCADAVEEDQRQRVAAVGLLPIRRPQHDAFDVLHGDFRHALVAGHSAVLSR